MSAVRPPHAAAAGLLLWAQQTGDISQLLHAAGECGQCRVVS